LRDKVKNDQNLDLEISTRGMLNSADPECNRPWYKS